MKRLTFLSFILAALVTPVQAQTQQSNAPPTFNGHVWDPPVQQYDSPPMVRVRPPASRAYRSYAAPPPAGYGPPPVGYDGPYGDPRAQRYR